VVNESSGIYINGGGMTTHGLTAEFLRFSDSRYVPQLMGTKVHYYVNNIFIKNR
jgi:hypothetical protein